MPNSINQAVEGQENAGIQRLRDTGRLGYRATSFRAGNESNGVGEALMNFASGAARAYAGYSGYAANRADSRSDEIIRKLTPDQRREARANGTLLYQDDPYTMGALARKTGRNAAYEVDTEVQTKIGEGKFKSPQDLQDYLSTRRNDAAKAFAEANGLDPEDQHYKEGFDTHITQRNAALFDTHARYLSERFKATATMQAASDLGSLFDDPAVLHGEDGPAHIAAYLNDGLASGDIGDENMAVAVLSQALQNNSTKPGADKLFKSIGDQTINLYGKPAKIRDIVGDVRLAGYESSAAQATFQRNRELQDGWDKGLQNAMMHPIPAVGMQMLDKMDAQLRTVQGTDAATPQSEALMQTRQRILMNQKELNEQAAKVMTKQTQAANRQAIFESRYSQRRDGAPVSTDWKTFQTDENTGEKFTKEDAANFAFNKLQQIDSLDLDDTAKTRLKLSFLNADYDGGPFREIFKSLATDADSQYKALVTSDSAEVNEATTAKISQFMKIYQGDPATMAGLYPEQAALAERITNMASGGMGLDVMIDGDRKARGASKEQRALADQKWNEFLTDSSTKVPFLPGSIAQAARTLYDSEIFRMGDEGKAKDVVDRYLDKTTVTFGSSTATQGVVKKQTLMVDPQNAASWQQGRDILNEHLDALVKEHPYINREDLSITEVPGGLRISDPLGAVKMAIPISTDLLRQEWQHRKAKADDDLSQEKDRKVNDYKLESDRRNQSQFKSLDPSVGTVEGAFGFRDTD